MHGLLNTYVSTKVRSWLKKTAINQKRYVMVEKDRPGERRKKVNG